jgi:hypothetical protein
MEPKTLQQTTDEMRTYIQLKTAEGFHTAKEIETWAVEVFVSEQQVDVLQSIAKRLTREAIQAQRAAQRGWPPETDCDLLDRAFSELERAGVVARHNFTCCGT